MFRLIRPATSAIAVWFGASWAALVGPIPGHASVSVEIAAPSRPKDDTRSVSPLDGADVGITRRNRAHPPRVAQSRPDLGALPPSGFLEPRQPPTPPAAKPDQPIQRQTAKDANRVLPREHPNAIRTRYAEILKGRDFANEIVLLTRAIQERPAEAVLYHHRGGAYRISGDYRRAAADYDKAIALNPKLSHAYNGRGLNFFWQGAIDRAIADFDRALAVEPSHQNARKNRDDARAAKFAAPGSENPLSPATRQMIELVKQGNELITKRDFPSAIDRYSRALGLESGNFMVLYLRARAYDANREYERAVADFNRLLVSRPSSSELLNTRGVTYKNWGRSAQALADYDRALVFAPNYIPAINNRGVIFKERGEHDKAIAEFNRVLAIKPNDVLALINRGSVRELKGEFDRAIEDYDKAIALEPNNARATRLKQAAILAKTGQLPAPTELLGSQNRRQTETVSAPQSNSTGVIGTATGGPVQLRDAAAMVLRGENDKAVIELSRVLSADRDNTSALILRGIAFQRLKQYSKSLTDLNRAAGLRPKDADVVYQRALVHSAMGSTLAALADFDRAVALNPKHSQAYHMRGLLHLIKRDVDRALADFDRAIDLNSNFADAYSSRGFALTQKGRFDNALSDIERAIALNPRHPTAFTHRGFLFNSRGEYDRALAALDRALEINPTSGEAHAYRGNTYVSKKEYDRAIADLDRAISLQPKLALAYALRGTVFLNRSQHAQAIVEFDKAIELGSGSLTDHFQRAKAHEALANSKKALDDYRTMQDLKPTSLLEIVAQTEAKKRIEALTGGSL